MAFTYFFRDLQTLETISTLASPSFRRAQHIHIWDAGCAMGPEPYSLAIILRESMGSMVMDFQLIGGNADAEALGKQLKR